MRTKIIRPISKTIFIFFAVVFLLPKISQAATINATSCSAAVIQTTINSANDGDTITFSGNCTWIAQSGQNYAVIINKPITLQGVGNPIITHGDQRQAGSAVNLILISLPSEHANDLARVTGIYFENTVFCPSCGANNYTPDIFVAGKATKFRIDHNTFHNGKNAVRMWGWVNGVIDGNTFIDVDLSVQPADDPDYNNSRPTINAWGRPMNPGSSDFVFIENNTFTTSNKSGCMNLNEYVYHHNGARAVTRYNTIISSCTESLTGFDAIDAHGYFGCDRGSVLMEIYNNNFQFTGGPLIAWFNLRGGSYLIHDNIITTRTSPAQIRLWNEGNWNAPQYTGDTVWPSKDQVNNSFFWNNKANGSNLTGVIYAKPNSSCTAAGVMWGDTPMTCCTGAGTGTCDDFFVQKGRDFFMEAPKASGQGYEKWGSILPTQTGTKGGKNMAFVSGASAYYPYTSYQCPHPLTGLNGSCDPAKQGAGEAGGYNINSSITCTPGDANSDGNINISDVQTCINVILGTDTTHQACSDMNTSNTVDITDCQAIINKILNP